MHSIDTAAGQVIATDTRTAVDAIDKAVMSFANLCASILEVSKASNLPVNTAQSALQNAANGLSKLVSSREDISRATHDLVNIKKASVLETTSFGCPTGCPKPDSGPQGRKADIHKTAEKID